MTLSLLLVDYFPLEAALLRSFLVFSFHVKTALVLGWGQMLIDGAGRVGFSAFVTDCESEI